MYHHIINDKIRRQWSTVLSSTEG